MNLYYGIWCEVWGGAPGPRHSWLKSNDSAYKRFATHADAEAEAARLNGPNACYTAAVLGDTDFDDDRERLTDAVSRENSTGNFEKNTICRQAKGKYDSRR